MGVNYKTNSKEDNMNANKLLSAMIIAVMVASVCAVPFAAAEEPAAEDKSVLKEGDSYGLWINISKADIYRIANEAIGTDLIKIDDNYVKGLIESEIEKTGKEVENFSLTFDFNAKAGIAASIITVTDEVNTYRATGIVDATLILNGSYETVAKKYIDVPPEIDDENILDYIDEHKDLIEENKILNVSGNASINLGIAIDASISVDNKTGILKSIDGKIGLYVEMKSESSRYDSCEGVDFKVDDKEEMYGNMYIEAKSFEKDNVTMIQSNGIKSGFGDMDDMFFEVDEMEDIETPLSAGVVEGTLSSIKSITEIDKEMLGIVAGIINKNDDILAKLPDDIKNKEGKLDVDLIPEEYLLAINKVFGFIFGDDGLALTDKEVSDIRQSASDVLNIGMSKISSKEFTVEFYPDLLSVDDPTKVVKKTVKFGNPVEMTDDVRSFMNAPEGKVFIGWYACVSEDGKLTFKFEGPDAIGMVTCDMKLVPVFADKKMSIKDIYDALDDQNEDEIFASLGNDDEFDATKLEGKDNVHIEISNDSTVGSVMWNFKGNNIGATGEVKLGYDATKEGSVVTVAFKHSGALPDGTSVTIDMSSSFDAGTVLKVYHIVNDEKTLVTGTATVGTDGKVTIPIASCSSYSFEANDAFSSIVNVGDDGGSDGGINMLLVGGGIAAVAVIGVGAFLFMRRQ